MLSPPPGPGRLRIPGDLGPLGLGTAGLGNLFRTVTDEDARATVEAAWQGGIRYFDTAPHYGLGLSERRLGDALRRHPREAYLLSTKVGRLLRPTPDRAGGLDDQGFVVPAAYERVWDPSPRGVRRSLAESLDRLGTERIDIAYLHDPDEYDLVGGVEVGMRALAQAREQGLVRAIGIGSKSVAALEAGVRTGRCDLIMVAGRITLLDDSGTRLLALCRERGVGIVNVGVFNSGALAADRLSRDLTYEYAPITSERLADLQRVHGVCGRFGVRVADAAVQFATRWPEVVNVTVGACSPGQIRRSLAGMAERIDPALWTALTGARSADA